MDTEVLGATLRSIGIERPVAVVDLDVVDDNIRCIKVALQQVPTVTVHSTGRNDANNTDGSPGSDNYQPSAPPSHSGTGRQSSPTRSRHAVEDMILNNNGPTTLRLVEKSLPCADLLKYAMAQLGTSSIMLFHTTHVPYLLRAMSGLPVQYLWGKWMPIGAIREAINDVRSMGSVPPREEATTDRTPPAAAITDTSCLNAFTRDMIWLVDTPTQLETLFELLVVESGLPTPVRFAIELDIGLRRGGIRNDDEMFAVLNFASSYEPAGNRSCSGAAHSTTASCFIFEGFMGYDGHVTHFPIPPFTPPWIRQVIEQAIFIRAARSYERFLQSYECVRQRVGMNSSGPTRPQASVALPPAWCLPVRNGGGSNTYKYILSRIADHTAQLLNRRRQPVDGRVVECDCYFDGWLNIRRWVYAIFRPLVVLARCLGRLRSVGQPAATPAVTECARCSLRYATYNDVSLGNALLKPYNFNTDGLVQHDAALFVAAPVLKVIEPFELPFLGRWFDPACGIIAGWLAYRRYAAVVVYGNGFGKLVKSGGHAASLRRPVARNLTTFALQEHPLAPPEQHINLVPNQTFLVASYPVGCARSMQQATKKLPVPGDVVLFRPAESSIMALFKDIIAVCDGGATVVGRWSPFPVKL